MVGLRRRIVILGPLRHLSRGLLRMVCVWCLMVRSVIVLIILLCLIDLRVATIGTSGIRLSLCLLSVILMIELGWGFVCNEIVGFGRLLSNADIGLSLKDIRDEWRVLYSVA